MTQEHPITPPLELAQKIANGPDTWLEKISKAYCAGADQELEACCKLLELSDSNAREFLTAARRPKPPSLKEQALEALDSLCVNHTHENIIRRALESLPD